jgi:predicted peroxiredoxin
MSITQRLSASLFSAALMFCPLAVGGAVVAAQPAFAQTPPAAQSQQIVIHLGSYTNDLHSSFMALSLATNLQKAGAKVTVFLDREGVRLADVRERGDLTWGDSGGTATAMADFTKAGGKILVCPHCAHLAGIDAANIRPGSRLATQEEVTALFLGATKVVDF